MKVILLADVKGLGKAGDIKEVKNGYGFNFLLPESLADLATPGALKQAEKFIAKRKEVAALNSEKDKAEAALLAGKKVTIKSKAEGGKLFGSVGRTEVATALEAMGIKIEEKNIALDKALKEVGVFPVEAHFGHEVKAQFEVEIVSE